jgi:glutathione-regulated potassium-efflux system ancillary protein KefG
MGRRVDVDTLITTRDVAAMLGLTHHQNVSGYLNRYPDMPRPVIDLGRGHPKLWVRQDIERWQRKRTAKRERERTKRPASRKRS